MVPSYTKTLDDVVILRLTFCLLIIMYHALCPYGVWDSIVGIGYVNSYRRLAFLLVNLSIPGFIFISGYLYGYNTKSKPFDLTFNGCVIKKIKRLLIPSIVFSAIYLLLYAPRPISAGKVVYEVFNGYAHLWFLPMLFLCFVFTWMLTRFQWRQRLILVTTIVTLVSICPCPSLPLHLNLTLKYFLYFYMGFGIQQGVFDFLKPPKTYGPIGFCLSMAIVAFALTGLLPHATDIPHEIEAHAGGGGILLIINCIMALSRRMLQTICSVSSVFTVYWLVNRFIFDGRKVPTWIINISNYCMGVYVFQQFVLVGLYYHTHLPQICGTYALPWVGFAITVPVSFAAAYLMRQFRWGRFLIG